MQIVGDHSLLGMPMLQEAYFTDNEVESVGDGAFVSTANLRVLGLDGNRLIRVPRLGGHKWELG